MRTASRLLDGRVGIRAVGLMAAMLPARIANTAPPRAPVERGVAGAPKCTLAQLTAPATSLVPKNAAPGEDCAATKCLVEFKGYQWWTAYDWTPANGYYNGGAGTAYAPANASVDGSGNLHLKVLRKDLGGGPQATGADVVLMFKNGDMKNPVFLGYGRYLVAAKITTAPSWQSMDPNVAFGAFTYERVDGSGTTSPANPNGEIDLAEVSRWGNYGPAGSARCTTAYPNLMSQKLCGGTSQFTLQNWQGLPDGSNLRRYSIDPSLNTITLVLEWRAAHQPVKFVQYNGAYTFATLNSLHPKPAMEWTTSATAANGQQPQNDFVPAADCAQFHLNLWFGNYPANNGPNTQNPGPGSYPQEVVVSDFQFQPF